MLCFPLSFWCGKSNRLWLRIKSLKFERHQNKLPFLEYLDCYESDARIKTKSLLIESSSANGTCSIETLVGWIIPALSNEFDYRNKLIILNISSTLWLSGLWWKGKKYWYSKWIILNRCHVCDWDLDWTNQASSCWDLSVWISMRIIITSTSYDFLTIRIPMRGTKSIVVYWNSSPRVGTIWLRSWLDIYICIFAEKWVSKSRNFNTNRSFSIISMSISQNDIMQQTFFRKKTCIFCLWIIWDKEKTNT